MVAEARGGTGGEADSSSLGRTEDASGGVGAGSAMGGDTDVGREGRATGEVESLPTELSSLCSSGVTAAVDVALTRADPGSRSRWEAEEASGSLSVRSSVRTERSGSCNCTLSSRRDCESPCGKSARPPPWVRLGEARKSTTSGTNTSDAEGEFAPEASAEKARAIGVAPPLGSTGAGELRSVNGWAIGEAFKLMLLNAWGGGRG